MMNAIHLLRAVGVLLLVLFALNFWLPRWFDWRTELPRLSRINQQIVRSHAVFIALVILIMSAGCLLLAEDLMRPSRLARALLGTMTAFWFLRLLAQWFLYDHSLWRGDRRRTIAQFTATGLWLAITAALAFAWWTNVRQIS